MQGRRVSPARVYGTTSTGDVLRVCDGGIRRDEYDGVCATVEGAKPQ